MTSFQAVISDLDSSPSLLYPKSETVFITQNETKSNNRILTLSEHSFHVTLTPIRIAQVIISQLGTKVWCFQTNTTHLPRTAESWVPALLEHEPGWISVVQADPMASGWMRACRTGTRVRWALKVRQISQDPSTHSSHSVPLSLAPLPTPTHARLVCGPALSPCPCQRFQTTPLPWPTFQLCYSRSSPAVFTEMAIKALIQSKHPLDWITADKHSQTWVMFIYALFE